MSKRRCCSLFWLYLTLAVIWLWGLGFIWFYLQVPRQGDFAENTLPTDAIVVLTGGMGRLEHGIRLLQEGRANMLLISGVDKDVKPAELVAQYAIDTGHPVLADGATRIVLDYGPRDTVGNARDTARWMREHGFTSLRLVTSSYHLPRSLMEFRHAMPDIIIVADPVYPEWTGAEKIVTVPRGSLRLILLEYHKTLFRRLYYALPQEWQVLAPLSSRELPAADIPLGAPPAAEEPSGEPAL